MRGIIFQDAAVLHESELLQKLNTSLLGLDPEEATHRLLEYPKPKSRSIFFSVLFRQFRSAFIYLLLVAALLSAILGEMVDAVLILLFLFINAGLGWYQEYRAEHALMALDHLLTRKATVRRLGTLTSIDVKEIVEGDIVIVTAGDMIPADGRFLKAEHILVDESSLTGESVPISKIASPLPIRPENEFGADNIGFAKTTVIEGDGELLVTGAQQESLVGVMMKQVERTHRVSAFEEGMQKFSGAILRMVVAAIPILILLNVIVHEGDFHLGEFFVFTIALMVSAIPEALPLVTTLALSRGALHLAKRSVIPRRLSAIEDLGTMEVLCTDKTGTITENRLTIKEIFGDRDKVLHALRYDPETSESELEWNVFDRAIMEEYKTQKKISAERIDELPFDPDRRRESVLVEEKGERFVIIRGALEFLDILDVPSAAVSFAEEMGRKGCRVLAVAKKPVSYHVHEIKKETENGAQLIGVAAFFDPLKESTVDAVKHANHLGVKVKIITGDSREVAGWVGYESGILAHPENVMLGHEFLALSEGEKRLAVESYDVFARTTPLVKKEIIEHMKERYVTGFLGEGFNDAPALKLAHVGLVVDGASDIARDASDIILANPSLSVIIDGIREGRRIFANTMKYARITIAANFGNFFAIALSTLFIPFLPMLPIQVLLLNLLSDFPMITIASDQVDTRDINRPRRGSVREVIQIALVLGIVSMLFDFVFFLYFFGEGEQTLQTMWFIGSMLTELALLFSLRTLLPIWKGSRPDKTMSWLVLGTGSLALLLPFTSVGNALFHFSHPLMEYIFAAVIIVFLYFLTTECVKILFIRLRSNHRIMRKRLSNTY